MRRALLCGALGLALLAGAPVAQAQTSLANPPAGANDFNCIPTSDHPDPIVLVHGLGATMGENWSYLSPLLRARGYCVFALTYGVDPREGGPYIGGVLPIEQSARELDSFVARVLTATGADKIDLVGHSEGTFMPQYWLKFLGGAAKTNRYVAMTPLYGGSTVYGVDKVRDIAGYFGLAQPAIDLVASFCGSCPEFLAGSPMQRKLVEGGAAAPGVEYTTIMSELDELVIPWSSGYMEAPGAHNYVLQEICPHDYSEHALVAFDPVAAQLVFNALDPAHAHNIICGGMPSLPGL